MVAWLIVLADTCMQYFSLFTELVLINPAVYYYGKRLYLSHTKLLPTFWQDLSPSEIFLSIY